MPKYNPVSPNLWDQRFRSLRPNTQRLYLYIITSPHRHSEGLCRMLPAYICVDTGMTEEEVSDGLEELQTAGWIMFDAATDMLLDCRAMEFYPPRGPSQQAGALRVLKALPSTHLKRQYAKLAYIHCPDYYEVIVNGIEDSRGKEDGCPELIIDEQSLDTLLTPRPDPVDSASRARARQLREGEELESSSQPEPVRAREKVGDEESSGWKYGQPIETCLDCGQPCHTRDPQGQPRHHGKCSNVSRLRIAVGEP